MILNSNNKSILILSYWFPPANVIGASRPWALAKYLKKIGWNITVVCASTDTVPNDYIVNFEGIEVISVPDSKLTAISSYKAIDSKLKHYLKSLLRYFILPDSYLWSLLKIKSEAKKIINKGRLFDVIFSTALPFSTHLIAVSLSREYNIPLVLDNRDFWSYSNYRRRIIFSGWAEKIFEAYLFSKADLIISIGEQMNKIYQLNHPSIRNKFQFIRNGIDVIHLPKNENSQLMASVSVVYTGILYNKKRDIRPALIAFRELLPTRVECNFYGTEIEQLTNISKEFKELSIRNCGHVSRQQSIDAQLSADFLLLALGNDEIEKCFLPGKFFEYLATGKPIIAIVDQDSEIAKIINSYDLGVATRSSWDIGEFMKKYITGKWHVKQDNLIELTRDFQFEKLNRLMLNCIEIKSKELYQTIK